jgi:hypothetical protein
VAYASLGFDRIEKIADMLQEFKDALTSPCKNLANPGEALAGLLDAFASALISTWKDQAAMAQQTLDISQRAISDAPEFGDQSHDTKTPPPSVNPAWRTGRWQPGAGGVPGTA